MADYPILEFQNQNTWREWLGKNHSKFNGIWLKIYKKCSNQQTVTYDEALDEALCYGWIDGQCKKCDAQSFLQKFTPRRDKSLWSKRNTEHVQRLEKQGKLQKPGRQQIQKAKQDGRWQAAYHSHKTMQIPEDFLLAVQADDEVHKFYQTLSKSSLFKIYMDLQTAKKPETREKRFMKLLQMLYNKQKPI